MDRDRGSGNLAEPRRISTAGLALILATLVCLGCGGGKGRPKTYPVEGKLTLDGQPFGPALVMLQSTDLKSGPIVVGEADPQGNLKFNSARMGDGAPAGEYKFVVPPDPMSRAPKPVPKIYESANTSPITIKIEPKKNTISPALESNAVDTTTPGARYIAPAKKSAEKERPAIDPKLLPKGSK